MNKFLDNFLVFILLGFIWLMIFGWIVYGSKPEGFFWKIQRIERESLERLIKMEETTIRGVESSNKRLRKLWFELESTRHFFKNQGDKAEWFRGREDRDEEKEN